MSRDGGDTPVLTLPSLHGEMDDIVLSGVVSVLVGGGAVVYPSDTVYGLCCRADRPGPPDRLRALKGCRADGSAGRPMIVLVPSIPGVLRLSEPESPSTADELMRAHWPGPLTLVMKASRSCPAWLRAADGTIAVRVPADPLSTALLRLSGLPLVSTSANLSGCPPPLSIADVPDVIVEGCDLVIDGGTLPPRAPSTIVRVDREGLRILRKGDLDPLGR